MTIIVETGAIVPGANSYVSTAELVAYAADRGITIADDAAAEVLLIKAMDYTEGLSFKGIKFTKDQPLEWPRANVLIDGYLVYVNEIPSELKAGVYETALAINSGEDPLADVARVQQSVKVGSLAVTYASGSSSTTLVRKINNAFKKLLTSGGTSGSSFEVKR